MSLLRRRPKGHDEYRPIDRRRRLGIVVLAVATALVVMWLLLERPGAVFPPRPLPASAAGPATCADGQGSGCIGGRTEMLMIPAPTASAPR